MKWDCKLSAGFIGFLRSREEGNKRGRSKSKLSKCLSVGGVQRRGWRNEQSYLILDRQIMDHQDSVPEPDRFTMPAVLLI